MSQVFISFAEQTTKAMKAYYKKELKTTPAHAIFQAKTPNAVITAYRSYFMTKAKNYSIAVLPHPLLPGQVS